MVIINGNPLKKAYTYGREVGTIFCNRTEVWPTERSTEPSYYYISWTPEDLSGYFKIDGTKYYFQDYSGFFSDYSGVITQRAFATAAITTLKTNAISIGVSAFGNCRQLETVNLTSCTYIDNYAFTQCYSLTNVILPMCSYIGMAAFARASKISSISLPLCECIDYGAFMGGTKIKSLDLPVCSYLGDYLFSVTSGGQIYVTSFNTITLRSTSVCQLSSRTFYCTELGSKNGSIYVPSSLVSAYKSAENWSYYSSMIFSIPE